MRKSLKLIVPIILGILAASLNWFVLKDKTTPGRYIKVKEDVKAGAQFAEDNLGLLEISADDGSLKETAVPYQHRSILFSNHSLRNLKKGDLVLWRDVPALPEPGEDQLPVALEGASVVHPRLLVVGNEITFVVAPGLAAPTPPAGSDAAKPAATDLKYVGPFRIVSVDGSLLRQEDNKGQERKITVALKLVKGKADDNGRELMEAIKAREQGQHPFVEIILHPPRRS